MGNHENEMIHSGFRIVNALLHDEEVYGSNDWFSYGGKETLLSYGILAKDENGSLAFTKDIALWTRDFETLDEVEIFNIYGHSPVQNGAKEEAKYINIDIGCCYAEEMGYGVLTAYCVESGEIVSVLNS